jgi:hypothetical protein
VGVKIKSGEILPNFKKKGVKYFITYARTLRIKIYFSFTSTDELDRVYKVRFVLVVVKITGINSGYVSLCIFFPFFVFTVSLVYTISYREVISEP